MNCAYNFDENASMWFEPLPDQCPPGDAIEPDGVYYRLTDGSTAVCKDFWSHRKIWPTKKFHTSECIAMSISVFTDPGPLIALKKIPLHAKKSVVAVKLVHEAGKIKQTGSNPLHHSWWRADAFDVLRRIEPISI